MTNQETRQQEDMWNARLDALREYAKREAHTRVPAGHVERVGEEDVRLGSWVSYLRTRYRKELLDGRRISVLEKLPGWEWGPLRPGPRSDTQRDSDILKMRESGMSLAAIGEKYGLSRQRIHQIIKKQSNGKNG